MLANTATRYGAVARTLHWIIALLVLADLALGLIGKYMPRNAETVETLRLLYSSHKTIGIVVLILALIRVVWAFSQTRPVPIHPERKAETLLAEVVHWALYGAIFLMPISGWITHSAEVGFAPIWWPFGQSLPFVPKSESVAATAASVHWAAGLVLIAVVALHVAGALKHAIIDRDGTMERMLRGDIAGRSDAPAGPHVLASVLAAGLWIAVIAGALTLWAPEAEHAAEPAPQIAEDTDPAQTSEHGWQVQDGTLAIAVQQMGSSVAGEFGTWSADIDYDPETGTGAVAANIDTTSLALGSVTDQAKGAEFFDVETYQTAKFEGDIARVDGTQHRADGTVTLVGQTAPVTVLFDLEIDGDVATMSGTAELDRRDYDIGTEYPDESTVGFPVQVEINLTAQQRP